LLAALQTVSEIAAASSADEGPPFAAPAAPGLVPPGQDLTAALNRAWAFLEKHQRGGTFGLGIPGADEPEPGITAMCLSGALWVADQQGRQRPAWIDAGLDFLVSLQRPDGSIQMHGLDVYTTAVSVEALVAAGREKDRLAVEHARDFLVATQSDEGEGYDQARDVFYGGTGYGDGERPDLSNTQMAVQAVALAGTSREDPFFAKTRTFLDKCQNFGEREQLTFPHPGGGRIVSGNDGGGTYFPGNSEAGEIQVGDGVWQPRSYGSMSYALAKTWVLCGIGPEDPRVQAVVRWLARNFSVDSNPGFATPAECQQGLYYYRLVMARTLALLPAGSFQDEHGQVIAWRDPLLRRLLDSQREDGSWMNTASPRWWEGAPTLATAYALLALKAAQP
jgi:squalene-hopene/tetraprenyl-beta-curcumene cyclase